MDPGTLSSRLGITADRDLAHPYRPQPDASGELKVDPGILLKAQKMDLAVEFFYGNKFTDDGPYGKQRSASVDSKVVSDTSGGSNIEVRRGDGQSYFYQRIGASGGITTYQSYSTSFSPSTVIFDGTDFTACQAGCQRELQMPKGIPPFRICHICDPTNWERIPTIRNGWYYIGQL
jgi:hypothetical protein